MLICKNLESIPRQNTRQVSPSHTDDQFRQEFSGPPHANAVYNGKDLEIKRAGIQLDQLIYVQISEGRKSKFS